MYRVKWLYLRTKLKIILNFYKILVIRLKLYYNESTKGNLRNKGRIKMIEALREYIIYINILNNYKKYKYREKLFFTMSFYYV